MDWIAEADLDAFRQVLEAIGADEKADMWHVALEDLQDPDLGMIDADITRLWNKIMLIQAREDARAQPSDDTPPPLPSEAPPPVPTEAPPPIPTWD